MTELRALSEGRIPLINFDNLGWETNNQNRIHKKSGPPALRPPVPVGALNCLRYVSKLVRPHSLCLRAPITTIHRHGR